MATEKLKFKLELFATMWDRPPHLQVWINNDMYFNDDITGTEDSPSIVEFEHEFKEGKSYELVLKRSGKGRNQTVINDNGEVFLDQLLHI